MNILKNYAFTLCLLVGILIGGICGIIFGKDAVVVKPVGDIFLNLMFVLIVPLVFLSVSSSVCNMRQSKMVGAVIRNIVFVFLFTSLVVALLAYFFTLLYNPLEGIDTNLILATMPELAMKKLTSAEIFVNTLTVSDFLLLFTKSNLLPLIIFSVFFGVATAMCGDKGKPVSHFLNAANAVILKMMGIIMYAAPIGLGCYFAHSVGQLGGQILNGYLNVFLLYLVLTLISFFLLNSIYVFIAGGKKAFVVFWKNMLSPSLMAIATSSSAACIPVNIEAAKRMGIPFSIAETVIPLGTNINKSGSVIGGVLKIFFLFAVFGGAVSGNDILAVVGVAMLVGIVMGAIPSGGMTGELLICSVFGFIPELAATLMIISAIIDIPATLLNSTGNVVSSLLVTRLTEGKDWIKKQDA